MRVRVFVLAQTGTVRIHGGTPAFAGLRSMSPPRHAQSWGLWHTTALTSDKVRAQMGNDSGDLSVQEKEANVSAQLEELEALEAIYGEGYEAVRGSAASPQVCSKHFIRRECRCTSTCVAPGAIRLAFYWPVNMLCSGCIPSVRRCRRRPSVRCNRKQPVNSCMQFVLNELPPSPIAGRTAIMLMTYYLLYPFRGLKS